jgi:hypothetical protein
VAESLAGSHIRSEGSPLARVVSKLDQASVEAHISMANQADTKISQFLGALETLITNSELGVNFVGGQIYVMAEKTAVVVTVAVNLARDHLKRQKIVLPSNTHLYDMLRQSNLVEADSSGHCVRKIRIPGKFGTIQLSALIFPTEEVVPKEILPTLPPTRLDSHGPRLNAEPRSGSPDGTSELQPADHLPGICPCRAGDLAEVARSRSTIEPHSAVQPRPGSQSFSHQN